MTGEGTTGPPTFGIRREIPPAPIDPGEEPELAARIRAEIVRDGPLTVARFMELALYEPGLGYYRRLPGGPGVGADFLTGPEADPIFGAAIGRFAEGLWEQLGRPARFVVTEHGAGTGALALGLLDGLRRRGSPLLGSLRYRLHDLEPSRLELAAERIAATGLAEHLELAPPAGPETGMLVANEVIDALPVHRVVRRGAIMLERWVAIADDDARLVEVDGAPAAPALVERLRAEAITLADGQVAEICLALEPWIREAAAVLGTGVVLVIDYGEEAGSLYRPDRMAGTLRGFARHAVTGDPFAHVGRQDLTAHVDLTALRAAAAAARLEPAGATTQAEFLAAVGAGELVAERLRAPDARLEDALSLRSALARLLDPTGMGGFHVLAFGRGVPAAPLPGFERLTRPDR